MEFTGPTRFKPDAARDFAAFKAAAEAYVAKIPPGDLRGLIEKPLDWNQGHPQYFGAMYQLLNALQAIALPDRSRIVEVGSGSGWATEVIASLRYFVDCVEPSREMIDVAKRRVRTHLAHHGVERLFPNVTWQCATVEECELPDGRADAVLFYESFHHVIDEHAATRQAFRLLRPGGRLVILGESKLDSRPGRAGDLLERRDGRLRDAGEPFTDRYLVWLLRRHGFVDVTRHHSVNCLAPVAREQEPVRAFANTDAHWANLVLARKPMPDEQAEAPSAAPTPPFRPRPRLRRRPGGDAAAAGGVVEGDGKGPARPMVAPPPCDGPRGPPYDHPLGPSKFDQCARRCSGPWPSSAGYEHIDAGGNAGGLEAPAFLAMNPHGKVPVLRDGEAAIWESNAIVRYLCARYGAGGLCPADAAARAKCDGWMDWTATTLQPAISGLFLGVLSNAGGRS